MLRRMKFADTGDRFKTCVASFALPSVLAVACLLLAAAQAAGGSADWPQFRGPGGLGVADNPGLPDCWGTNQNVAWRIEVPGRGWSSPIVWGDRVFVTTVVSEGQVEQPKKGLYLGGERKEVSTDEHRWLVVCFDLASGRELWRQEAHHGAPPNPRHLKNSYASSTPVTDGERVYAYFPNVGVWCYDLDGHPLWSTNWPPVRTRSGWGAAASLALDHDRLFVVNDNDEASFAVALDAQTGRQLWRVARDEKSSWSSPFVWRNAQRAELVTCGSKRVRAYDLDGRLLWELGGMSSIAIPTPLAEPAMLYVSSGYVMDRSQPIFAVRPGATGDISLPAGQTNNQFVAWCQPTGGPYNPSPLLYQGRLYVVLDFGFLSCYEAATGQPLYVKQRVREGSATPFTASPWAANGKVFALSEEGDTFVFKAGPEYNLLRTNSIGEMCLATPAIAGSRLVMRSVSHLYCFQEGK